MKSIITLIILCGVLVSCSKDGGPQLDEEAPTIAIFAPVTGTILTSGQAFHLQVDLEENQEIHQYAVNLRTASMGFEVTLLNEHLDTRTFKIDQMVTVPNLPDGIYDLVVTASDHNGNSHQSTVEVVLE